MCSCGRPLLVATRLGRGRLGRGGLVRGLPLVQASVGGGFEARGRGYADLTASFAGFNLNLEFYAKLLPKQNIKQGQFCITLVAQYHMFCGGFKLFH